MPQISVRLPDDFTAKLEERGDRAGVIRSTLDRYWDLLQRARPALREKFSAAELSLIADASNGTIYDTWSIPALWMGIEDSINLDGTADKWSVDGPALVDKLKALTPAESHALVDAVERFWHAVGEGQHDRQPGELLSEAQPAETAQ